MHNNERESMLHAFHFPLRVFVFCVRDRCANVSLGSNFMLTFLRDEQN